MGGSYSDLNIYFNTKTNGEYSGTGYKVKTTHKYFTGYSSFVVFNHAIKYTNNNSQNYNVLLYDGSSHKYKGNYFFGYYYPSNNNEVIKEVHTYYSVLAPDLPLVITFKTEINQYNCLPSVLKYVGWDRAYRISKYSFGPKCTKEDLLNEFQKLSLKRKIRFTTEKENKEISGYRQEFGDYTSFRLIFIPNGNESVLGSDYLFSIDFIKNVPKLPGDPVPGTEKLCNTKPNSFPLYRHDYKIDYKNQIDQYYLASVNRQLYDGIMVYLVRQPQHPETFCSEGEYNKGMALLLEFVGVPNSKTHIKRKDKDGYWWSQEQVPYDDDTALITTLKQIKEQARNDVVIIILDIYRQYKGVTQFQPELGKTTYNKYTHTYPTPKTPNLLFERKTIKIGGLDTSKVKAKVVEVYYLKASGNEDTQPFLIIFYENGSEPTKKKNGKAYHFKDSYKFEDWIEFNQEQPPKPAGNGDLTKLYEKVAKIEKYGACIPNLPLLRWYAHEILIGKDPPKTEVKKKEETLRPPERRPPVVPESLPIPLIIGCVVAGVVVIVSLAVIYGVYWYNTTIKLLT